MLTDRETYFAFYGVEPERFDPKRPLTAVAIWTATILLDNYRRAEIARMNRLIERSAISDAWNERLKRENYALYVRACFLLGQEPDKITQAKLFA